MRRTLALTFVMMLVVAPTAQATVFFTDGFDYSDGQLTDSDAAGTGGFGDNVGGGNWNAHSGADGVDEWVDIVGGQAELLIDGSEDVNRDLGATMGAGNTWYFATTVTVNDTRDDLSFDLDNEYFMHFLEVGTFNLRGRVYVQPPTVASDTNFSFGLSSSSGGANVSSVDFALGSTHTLVASYDFDSGNSELWVDPVDVNSASIVDPTPNPNSAMTAVNVLGLRQGSNGNFPSHQVLVDIVSAADSFAEALAALGGDPGVDVDLDDDGDVDGADFLAIQRTDPSLIGDWQTQFGSGNLAAISAVPEPSTVMLIGLATMLLPLSRRRA